MHPIICTLFGDAKKMARGIYKNRHSAVPPQTPPGPWREQWAVPHWPLACGDGKREFGRKYTIPVFHTKSANEFLIFRIWKSSYFQLQGVLALMLLVADSVPSECLWTIAGHLVKGSDDASVPFTSVTKWSPPPSSLPSSLSTMIDNFFIFIVLVIIFMIFIFICLHLHSLHLSSFIFIHSLHLHSFVSFQSLSSSSFICLRSSWFILFIFIHVSSYSCCLLPTVGFFQWHLHRATQRPGYASCSPIPSAWDFQQQLLSFKSSLLMRCNEVIVVYSKTTLVNHDGFAETWCVSTWVQNCQKHHSFRIGCVLLRVNGDMMEAPKRLHSGDLVKHLSSRHLLHIFWFDLYEMVLHFIFVFQIPSWDSKSS